jgi:thioredoxin-like negative regulator of GroEL
MLGKREDYLRVIESALEKSRTNEKLRQKMQSWLDTEPAPQAQEFSVGRSPSQSLPEDVVKVIEEVDLALLAGHFGKAEDHLVKALRKQPEQSNLRHLLARCYALTQRPAAALSLWRKIVAE